MTERNYYGGESVHGNIRKLNAKNFKELYQNYFLKGVPLAYSREQFAALPKSKRDEIKQVAFVNACSFTEGTTQRRDEYAEHLQIVFLDIDAADEAGHIIQTIDNVRVQLEPYNFIIYTTANHTTESPRIRVCIDVEPTDVNNRVPIVRHVANILGLTEFSYDDEGKIINIVEKFDRVSKVASQPFYRPVHFVGDLEGSILSSRTDGRPLKFTEVDTEILEIVEKSYSTFGSDREFDDSCGIEYVPLQGLSLGRVREAMQHIDPDEEDDDGNSYFLWYQICCAFRHQFREEDDAREAFEIFNEWSEQGDKYGGREKTYRKWQAFVPAPSSRAPITIRTLFKRSIAGGWDHRPLTKELKQDFESWIEEVDDASVLASEGVHRISLIPFRDMTTENHLIAKLEDRLKKLGFKGVTFTRLEKELKREKRRLIPKEEADEIQPWLQQWCYLPVDNVFYNIQTGFKYSVDAFNNTFAVELMFMVPEEERGVCAKPPVLPKDYALNVKKLPRPEGCVYDPRFGGEPFITKEGVLLVNTYREHVVKLDAENSKLAGSILKTHIRELISEDYLQREFLDWMAYVVQNRGEKVHWCFAIQSAEGAGKSLLLRALAAILGPDNVTSINGAQIESDFNDWQRGNMLCAVEESRISGKGRFATMDRLKQVITDAKVRVNAKHEQAVEVDNTLNLILFTNAIDGLALEESNRRFCPIKSPIWSKAIAEKLKEKGHFVQLARLHEDLIGGLAHFLLNHKISERFDAKGRAPESPYTEQLKSDSEDPIKSEIIDMINDEGDHALINEEIVVLTNLLESLEVDTKVRKRVDIYLQELGYERYDPDVDKKDKRVRISGRLTYIWVHRDNFDPAFGSPQQMVKEIIEATKSKKLKRLEE